MTQPDGLSPRASRQHAQQSTSSACVTPTSCSRPGRFFEQEQHQQSTAGAMLKPKRPRSPRRPTHQAKAISTRPLISEQHNHSGNRVSSRVLGIIAAVAVIVPLLYVRSSGHGAEPIESRTRPSLRALSSAGAKHRCDARRSWGGVASESRAQCAGVLPSSVVEGQGWLVAVHVDRTPAVIDSPAAGKKRLRGSASQHRYLPHQYFVRAVEATLHGIATAEPGANVDIAVLSEGRWGGLVDEVGVPVDWDVPSEICGALGLHCSQELVMLDDPNTVPDAMECVSVADVFVASENSFSQASVTLSKHVKVLTDFWQNDEEEMIVALNPATTMAGMSASERKHLDQTMGEYSECSLGYGRASS